VNIQVDEMPQAIIGRYRVVVVRNPSVQGEMNRTILQIAVSFFLF
jgi:hypothetical protein